MINWELLATKYGYTSCYALFEDYYVNKQYSLRQLAVLFAVGRTTVKKYLLAAGIELRSKGGANHTRLNTLYEEDK